MSIGELWGSAPQKIEQASKAIGKYVHAEGLGASDLVVIFTVLAVRAARIAGATKEQYLNYAAQMYDDKSELPGRNTIDPLIRM